MRGRGTDGAGPAFVISIAPKRNTLLIDLSAGSIRIKGNFRCEACDNRCEIQRMEVGGKTYPFGGLCSKFENIRHGNAPKINGRGLH